MEAGIVSAQPSRWQVKLQATFMATSALRRINSSVPHNFDVKEARNVVASECQRCNSEQLAVSPSSCAALHADDIVAAACTASTATSGDNLITLQTAGLELLRVTLNKFADAKDPDSISDEPVSVLHHLTSQVTAALSRIVGIPIIL